MARHRLPLRRCQPLPSPLPKLVATNKKALAPAGSVTPHHVANALRPDATRDPVERVVRPDTGVYTSPYGLKRAPNKQPEKPLEPFDQLGSHTFGRRVGKPIHLHQHFTPSQYLAFSVHLDGPRRPPYDRPSQLLLAQPQS